MSLTKLLLTISIASPLSSASNLALDQAVSGLKSKQNQSCRGIKLSLSCGNWKCDKLLGENEDNCPSDCLKVPVKSYNNQIFCEDVNGVFKPTNTLEVQSAVQTARKLGLKVRVVGKAHSANTILCTEGVVLSTEKLNRIHGIRTWKNQKWIEVDSGATLDEVTEWLHKKNLSLGFPVMGFRGVSIGGAVATGSHGSSPKHSAVISSAVRYMKVVLADGTIKEYFPSDSNQNEFRAWKTSLGMLGVSTRIGLKVEPQFNLEVNLTQMREAYLLEKGGVQKIVEDCDWGQLHWFPNVGKIIRSCGKKTEKKADLSASNTLLDPPVPNFVVGPFRMVLQYSACHPELSCLIEKARFADFLNRPPFVYQNKKGRKVHSVSLVGPSHRMQSSVMTSAMTGFSQMDWEFAVPASKSHEVFAELRRWLDENKICSPFIGLFIRFAPIEDESLLAHSAIGRGFKKGELAMYVELPVYVPVGFDQAQMAAYNRPYDEFARLLMERFGARPHWGKNRDWAFQLQADRETISNKIDAFQKVANRLDPSGMFRNDFASDIGLAQKKK